MAADEYGDALMTQAIRFDAPFVRKHPATPERLRSLAGAPLSFRLAARILLQVRKGVLTFVLPTGERLDFGGLEPGVKAEVVVHNWAIARRVLLSGNMGFAEGYIDGLWDTPDLAAVLSLFSDNFDSMAEDIKASKAMRWVHNLFHAMHKNTKSGSRKNIHAHYDLGNDFYRLWLDDTMTYSSALFDHSSNDTPCLKAGQTRKYAHLADLLQLSEGDHVLEIGSGWGGFAEYAAGQRGARVTGVTISKEQYDFAQKRMFEAQLNDRVDIKLCDYRDIEGQYDGVASIEMFEAVGEEYWPSYFNKVREVLKPGGRAGLQIITVRDDLFETYRKRVDFIQRYVFPGGMLPSPTRLEQEAGACGLAVAEAHMFGLDYAETLRQWREQFLAAWEAICGLNARFDERFRRLWAYYLAYCEAGFRTGRIDVGQFVLSPQS